MAPDIWKFAQFALRPWYTVLMWERSANFTFDFNRIQNYLLFVFFYILYFVLHASVGMDLLYKIVFELVFRIVIYHLSNIFNDGFLVSSNVLGSLGCHRSDHDLLMYLLGDHLLSLNLLRMSISWHYTASQNLVVIHRQIIGRSVY